MKWTHNNLAEATQDIDSQLQQLRDALTPVISIEDPCIGLTRAGESE